MLIPSIPVYPYQILCLLYLTVIILPICKSAFKLKLYGKHIVSNGCPFLPPLALPYAPL